VKFPFAGVRNPQGAFERLNSGWHPSPRLTLLQLFVLKENQSCTIPVLWRERHKKQVCSRNSALCSKANQIFANGPENNATQF
jgi:hypothetical protein